MTEHVYRQGVATWMRQQREALGLKRAEVARALGVSPNSIGNWERGEASMSAYTERRVKALFKQAREQQQGKRTVTA